jgi:hypothetical protein
MHQSHIHIMVPGKDMLLPTLAATASTTQLKVGHGNLQIHSVAAEASRDEVDRHERVPLVPVAATINPRLLLKTTPIHMKILGDIIESVMVLFN